MLKHNELATVAHGERFTRTMAWTIAIVIVGARLWQLSAVSLGLPSMSLLAQAGIIVGSVGVMFVLSPIVRVSRVLALFVLWSLLTLLYNHVPGSSEAYARLAYFVLMAGVLSPLITGETQEQMRLRMWRLLVWGLNAVIAISFVMYLPWAMSGETGGYSGIAGHPMALGIIGTITLLNSSWRLLCRRPIGPLQWVIVGLMTAISIIVMIATGSRCAVVAAVAGLSLQVWAVRKARLKVVWGVGLIMLIGILCFTGITTSQMLRQKNEIALSHGSITFSRDALWGARVSEFASSPVVGIGFDVVDSERDLVIEFNDGSKMSLSPYEPGSSWLMVLSSTGIVGFLLILWFNVKIFRCLKVIVRESPLHGCGLASMMVALWIHGIFEGWLLYAGSMTFMIYWLLSSRIVSLYDQINKGAAH